VRLLARLAGSTYRHMGEHPFHCLTVWQVALCSAVVVVVVVVIVVVVVVFLCITDFATVCMEKQYKLLLD